VEKPILAKALSIMFNSLVEGWLQTDRSVQLKQAGSAHAAANTHAHHHKTHAAATPSSRA
jgi:hypothetical protein